MFRGSTNRYQDRHPEIKKAYIHPSFVTLDYIAVFGLYTELHAHAVYIALQRRGNIILIGDSLVDPKMDSGLPLVKEVLKIGFLNHNVRYSSSSLYTYRWAMIPCLSTRRQSLCTLNGVLVRCMEFYFICFSSCDAFMDVFVHQVEELLPVYLELYDIVVTEDGSLDAALAVLTAVIGRYVT